MAPWGAERLPPWIHRAYAGKYATSLEMAGASVSVMDLTDGLRDHLDAPASSPFFAQACTGRN
jgi:dihydroxyacetone kinase